MRLSKAIVALLLTLLPGISATAGTALAATSQANNLFIIVMNGVRYKDTYGDKNHLYFDNIWNKLKPLGTICTKFGNHELTLPIPAQASLLTGVWHVYKDPFSEKIRPAFPTLFEYWRSAGKDSANSAYFASCRPKYEILTFSEYAGFGSKYAPVFDDNKEEKVNENAIYEKPCPISWKSIHHWCISAL